ncbi:MAG: aminopeptidase [Clostridiaceae bacterium]|jgi:aminopeptidase|nr:aminopeptidase [Clostridiaceae bacterium]
MTDHRIEILAKNLVSYSCKVQPGEKVLIETKGFELPLTKALIKEVYKAGGMPFVTIKNDEITRALLNGCSEEQIKLMAEFELARMKKMDAYIGIRYSDNSNELGDVPEDKMKLYSSLFNKPVHSEQRVEHTKWVILRYPNSAMAQMAEMSTEAFEDYYFDVCNLDYSKMSKAMDPLVQWMERTDRVRIIGKNTDLSFSIKGMPAIKCDGGRNIPDGEVFSAPHKNSVNGIISYNTPAKYQGFTYENVRLEFKDGKIVKATANDTEKINQVFDTDEGARYVGEFSLGLNPYIDKPMKDTLFDEKIKGSFHFTPGSCYDECNNGNKSAIHWDLVFIQRPEYGGGEIWFDDVLVRKDGVFLPEELKLLNPENLK